MNVHYELTSIMVFHIALTNSLELYSRIFTADLPTLHRSGRRHIVAMESIRKLRLYFVSGILFAYFQRLLETQSHISC